MMKSAAKMRYSVRLLTRDVIIMDTQNAWYKFITIVGVNSKMNEWAVLLSDDEIFFNILIKIQIANSRCSGSINAIIHCNPDGNKPRIMLNAFFCCDEQKNHSRYFMYDQISDSWFFLSEYGKRNHIDIKEEIFQNM